MSKVAKRSDSRKELGVEVLYVEIPLELKRRINQAAKKAGVRLNVFTAKILAEHLGCPEHGEIPKGEGPGRRPKDLATA